MEMILQVDPVISVVVLATILIGLTISIVIRRHDDEDD